MAVAFDAVTGGSISSTTQHTPVGTPKGVLVLITQQGDSSDTVTGVTYGGVALARVATAADVAGEPGRVYAYFLGSGVPAGIQDSIWTSAGTNLAQWIFTFTAAGDTEIVTFGVLEGDQADPQIAVDSGAVTAIRCAILHSGFGVPSNLTEIASTTRAGTDIDWGLQVGIAGYETTPSSGSATIGWTATSEDVAMLAVAIKEAISAPSATVAATLPSLTADVAAHMANFFAEVVATLPSLTGSAAATTFAAQGGATLPAPTAAGVAATKNTGKGGNPPGKNKQPAANTGCTLPMLTVSIAAVTEPLSAVVDVTLPSLTAAGVAALPHEAAVAVTLPSLTAAGVASIPSTGGRPPQPGPGRITRSPSGSGRFISTKTATGRFRQPQQGQGR